MHLQRVWILEPEHVPPLPWAALSCAEGAIPHCAASWFHRLRAVTAWFQIAQSHAASGISALVHPDHRQSCSTWRCFAQHGVDRATSRHCASVRSLRIHIFAGERRGKPGDRRLVSFRYAGLVMKSCETDETSSQRSNQALPIAVGLCRLRMAEQAPEERTATIPNDLGYCT